MILLLVISKNEGQSKRSSFYCTQKGSHKVTQRTILIIESNSSSNSKSSNIDNNNDNK